jgi:hypothetical protein
MLHSGRELNADDVVARLKRWMEVSPRGKSVAGQVAELSGYWQPSAICAYRRNSPNSIASSV